MESCSGCLSRVLNEYQFVRATQFDKRIDPWHGTAHVDDKDCFCLRRDRSRHGTRIKAKCLVDLGEYRHCACEQHRLKVGDERKGRNNDFIAGSDAASCQGRAECGGTTGTDMRMSSIQPPR